jgi:hypothetical protein
VGRTDGGPPTWLLKDGTARQHTPSYERARILAAGNLAMIYGAPDTGCCSLGMAASALLMLGYPDQAHERQLSPLADLGISKLD